MSTPDDDGYSGYTGYGTEFYGGTPYGHAKETAPGETRVVYGEVFATVALRTTVFALRSSAPFEVTVDLVVSTFDQTMVLLSREVEVEVQAPSVVVDIGAGTVTSQPREMVLVGSAIEVIDI